jgi:hypothetical protein
VRRDGHCAPPMVQFPHRQAALRSQPLRLPHDSRSMIGPSFARLALSRLIERAFRGLLVEFAGEADG